MKAISLLQPWASLVALGAKQFETRSWGTRYRGLLAIHASQRFPRDCKDLCGDEPFYSPMALAYRENGGDEFLLDTWVKHVPVGAVIGIVRVVDCQRTEDLLNSGLSLQEQAFGDYGVCRYGWKLEVVELFPEPIPAKGSLGLWEWKQPEKIWARHGRC